MTPGSPESGSRAPRIRAGRIRVISYPGLDAAHLALRCSGTQRAVLTGMGAKCEHCDGDGEVEVCTVCANEVENCECDDEQPTKNEECPECHGDREVEEEDDE